MFDFLLFPRILLHSSNPDCVPLLQNLHHPAEGGQQEETDQGKHWGPGPWGETGTQKTQTPLIRMVYKWTVVCLHFPSIHVLYALHPSVASGK